MLILHQNFNLILNSQFSNDNSNFTENNKFGFVCFVAVLIAKMPITVCTRTQKYQTNWTVLEYIWKRNSNWGKNSEFK